MSEEADYQDDSNKNRHSPENDHSTGQNNSNTNNEKVKRHRRGKLDTTNERIFKCPDCEKSYLSGPALVIHRKTKHGYNGDGEKKARGRPKASEEQEISYRKAQEYYNNFFNEKKRKKKNENEKIDIETLKQDFRTIFKELKNHIFKEIGNVEDYPLYQLVTNLWDIKDLDLAKESYSEYNENKKVNDKYEKNCSYPPMEQVFYLYLKDLAEHSNKVYFEFGMKFIILYREFINNFKKNIIKKEEYKKEKDDSYSQLFSAEGVPESCNDFFLDFLQKESYFGNKDSEFIELAQHFCFWLYTKKYTQSYLTLAN